MLGLHSFRSLANRGIIDYNFVRDILQGALYLNIDRLGLHSLISLVMRWIIVYHFVRDILWETLYLNIGLRSLISIVSLVKHSARKLKLFA